MPMVRVSNGGTSFTSVLFFDSGTTYTIPSSLDGKTGIFVGMSVEQSSLLKNNAAYPTTIISGTRVSSSSTIQMLYSDDIKLVTGDVYRWVGRYASSYAFMLLK